MPEPDAPEDGNRRSPAFAMPDPGSVRGRRMPEGGRDARPDPHPARTPSAPRAAVVGRSAGRRPYPASARCPWMTAGRAHWDTGATRPGDEP
ncbi:predicted protein [Streptomyces viridosporus ATCC 14672]|uniref:Predicted protein n=1 Tax=Streptomyces viridosporus (strain ATCC 14672 / DSM 40746 / JCM 4963 / KCTC 9882 / NRRL B-12104 / FH 1290) TaxID=566461 RepID=D5ZUQ5_STRV1|nr:predicted protein [Streptomyces viridosporus ATCC 14672]